MKVEQANASAVLKQIRAVVVDDSPVAAATICSLLRKQPDVEVLGTGSDGQQAIDLSGKLSPNLVVLDVQMPGVNGLQAACELNRATPRPRIVIVTMYDSPELRQAAKDCGADAFVAKARLDQELPTVLRELFSCPG